VKEGLSERADVVWSLYFTAAIQSLVNSEFIRSVTSEVFAVTIFTPYQHTEVPL